MTNKAITNVWSVLALLGFYISINTVLKAQGSEIYFSFPRMENADRYGVTVYGIIISVPVLLLMFRLTIIYAKRKALNIWSEQLPIAFNQEVDSNSNLGKNYQGISISIFFVLPIIAQGFIIN